MNQILNRLDISFHNLTLTQNNIKKEEILNKVYNMMKCYRFLTDFINHLYMCNSKVFQEFLININKPSLILLIYDLQTIGSSINLSTDTYLTFYNNLFHIEYKPNSPKSNSSIHSEWGYNC